MAKIPQNKFGSPKPRPLLQSGGDKIKDWTKLLQDKEGATPILPDKNYAKHMIKPCKMIIILGKTGAGKSTALLEFLSRKQEFVEIIIFTGSTTDEPLYKNLEKHIEGIQLIDDPDQLPELKEYDEEDKSVERLMVFDDMINCSKKDKLKMQKWFNSSRKYGFTCVVLAQDIQGVPLQMQRNASYFMMFRLNDANTISNILRKTADGVPLPLLKEIYYNVTSKPNTFLTIDLTEPNPALRFRENFIGKIMV